MSTETEKRQAEQLEAYETELRRRNAELDEMSEKLGATEEEKEVLKSQLYAISKAEFDKEKKALVDQVRLSLGDEKATEVEAMIGEEPHKLESAKKWVGMLQTAIEKGAGYTPQPRGSVSLPQPSVPSMQQMTTDEGTLREIDRVYTEYKHQLRLQRQGRHDPQKLKQLEDERRRLWMSFIEGIKGRRHKEAVVAEMPFILNCPNCKFPLVGETRCRKCGYELSPTDKQKLV